MDEQGQRSMQVSVIIPTKNGAARLPTLFEALAGQTVGREAFEVIVVDDGSTDDTAAVVEASGIARVVQAGRSLGQGAASNLGILHAEGEVIAFTDDDTIPAPDWIERGRAAVMASPSGVVAGHVELMLEDRPTVPALMDFGRGYLDQRSYVADGFGATANLWVRREVLSRMGGFDGGAAWQTHDRDFGERIRLAGLTMVYAPDAVVRHPTRDRARDLAKVAYRLGLGAAWLRTHGQGEVRMRSPEWRRVRYWIPWRSIWGIERLQEQGHATRRRDRAKLRVVQYACLQVPLVAGSMKGSWQQARAGR
jgi:glycosyltransferase involved in cell wall biosynthesis